MISELFNTLVYTPLYNTLIYLIGVLPWHSVALATIVLTVIVKFVLLPLSYKMAKTQKAMKEITPEIEAIKEKYKDDKHTQTLKIMELYAEKEIKPFASFLLILIQLPIILGLYWVFFRSGLPQIDQNTLYSFVHIPQNINMHLLGISMADKSIVLAFFAGLTQFIHSNLTAKDMQISDKDTEDGSFKSDLQKSLQIQMRFVLPIFMGYLAYVLSAGIAMYFIVSNLFMIGQEYYFKFKNVK